MMTRPASRLDADRTFLRGICLVVKGKQQSSDRRPPRVAAVAVGKFPNRPESDVLSDSIPLFFIARNKNGLWVAREAEGRAGGIFLFKRSALRFAKNNGAPAGCATMFLAERLEVDAPNQGNRMLGWLDAVRRGWQRLIPKYPPPMPIGRKKIKGEWR